MLISIRSDDRMGAWVDHGEPPLIPLSATLKRYTKVYSGSHPIIVKTQEIVLQDNDLQRKEDIDMNVRLNHEFMDFAER